MDRPALRLGLVGWPVEHSLSPMIHRIFMRSQRIEGSYKAIAVHPDRAGVALRRLWMHGMDGLNVTAPCKLAALHACSALAPTARRAGATNTLTRSDSGWEGHNTDIAGFEAMVSRTGASDPFLVAGCGGGARAVAAFCLQARREFFLFCRRPEAYDGPGGALPLGRLEGYMDSEGGTLVNATPLGWRPDDPMPVPPEALAGKVLLDLNYSPRWEWRSRAAESALDTLTGDVMLVHQAAESFLIWTGRRPDTGGAETAVRAALASEDKERGRST